MVFFFVSEGQGRAAAVRAGAQNRRILLAGGLEGPAGSFFLGGRDEGGGGGVRVFVPSKNSSAPWIALPRDLKHRPPTEMGGLSLEFRI